MENNKNISREGIDILLQLGDVVTIIAPKNEVLNDKTFIIEYISSEKIKFIDIDTFSEIILPISSDGIIADGSIEHINIVSRNPKTGYARQNDLLPGTWVNIYFGGELPIVVTGEITNIEEDMIEIKTYPDKEVIYINFSYQGIPDDLPITSILKRKPPTMFLETEKTEVGEGEVDDDKEGKDEEKEKEEKGDLEDGELVEDDGDDETSVIVENIKSKMKEGIYDADQIHFGDAMGTIQEMTMIEKNKARHDISTQTDAMLNELLSNIPVSERTTKILNNIHTSINRFVQLRKLSSTFDNYNNVTGIVENVKKPLVEYLKKYNSQIS